MMWHNQLVRDSFCKLEELAVHNCENLMSIFPPNMLRRLQNLEGIRNCNSVEEVSTQLKYLYLFDLPKLKHVWSSDPQTMLTFQNLRGVQVRSEERRVGKECSS